jgi:hypothetical protein
LSLSPDLLLKFFIIFPQLKFTLKKCDDELGLGGRGACCEGDNL